MGSTHGKLIAIFVAVLFIPINVFAQITISAENKEIRSVIQQIERVSDYRFFYSSTLPYLTKKITIDVKNASIQTTLDKLFNNTTIEYIIKSDNQITLVSKKEVTSPQTKKILKGSVKDETGTGMVAVTIIVKGLNKGFTTDNNGNFIAENLPDNATLIFKYIGYQSKEISVNGRSNIDVVLNEESQTLDNIVVIGYGTLDKRELTSSVSSIKNNDLIKGYISNPLQAIVGKVPGLNIISNAGSDPNGSISVQLRGVNSIKADQNPLIVVDGIPGGNINILQREDIVSIDVLKDASAAAIYGTRASGGVILVTTRMGSEGKTQISYSCDLTTETILKKPEVLSADEWIANGFEDKGAKTDWFNVITRTPFTQRHVITMTGGSKSFSSYASLYYKNSEGMTIGSDRKEIGGRFNFSYKALQDHLEIIGRVNYVEATANYTDSDIFNDALALNPTISPYNANDLSGYNILTGNDEWNPLANIMLREDREQIDRLQANLGAKLNIIGGLSTTFTVGNTSGYSNAAYWESSLHRRSRDNNRFGYASQTWKRYSSESIEWVANYDKMWGENSIKSVIGYSFQRTGGSENFSGSNADFSIDGTKWYSMDTGKYLAAGRASMSSYKSPTETLSAYFGRINYSLKDRYLLSASLRYEGSSKFGENNRYGLFPAASLAWRISSEPFMKGIKWIDDLRIRFGYGRTGNEGFDPGVTTRMYKPDTGPWYYNGSWAAVYGLARNVNPDLQWETKDEYNIGVDFEIFNRRLSGKLDVYKRYVDNMIYDISVSQPPAVYATTTMNVGSMQNVGYEVELSGEIIRNKDWNYSTTITASHNESTLNSLWGSQTFWDTMSFPSPGSPGTAIRLAPNEKIGQFYIWKYAGIAEDGSWQLYDKDNNVIPASKKTQADKRYVGNSIPKLILSWDNTIRYKNLDLNIFFRSWIGHDIFNMTEMYYGLPNSINKNMLRSAYERNKKIKGEKELCDYFLEKGTFLKLDALSLGYTFDIPKIKQYVDNVRINFTGRNLFCLTDYNGLDPEVNVNGLTPGFEDLSVYPRTRIFTIGVQVNLK